MRRAGALASALVLALVLALVGCGSAARAAGPAIAAARAAPDAATRAREAADLPAEARTVIRNAAMTVIAGNVDSARASVEAFIGAAGGEVGRVAGDARAVSMTLRVPDGRLDATMDRIATLGRVSDRSVGAEDVSAEVIDLEARLANLVASRDRLRALQQRAETVNDVVLVERELARVQGEIDSLAGRRDHLRARAERSTLAVTIRARTVLGPLGAVLYGAGWVLQRLFVIR